MAGADNTLRRPGAHLAGLVARVAAREREVRDTLWLLASISWVLLPMVSNIPPWAAIAVFALVGWRATLTFTGHRLPPRWLLMLLLLAGAIAIMARFHTIFGKDAGVTYVVLLLGLKLLELRARRDIFVIICLSLFIMLTSLFDSQTLFHALWMVAGVVLLVSCMIRVNFAGVEPPWRTKLALSAQICALAVPLMAVLFVLFPRVQGPLWGMPGDAFGSHTGLSDSMAPGSFDRLIESSDPAFEVDFHGRSPRPAERYWRGPVLGSFDGRTWRPLPPMITHGSGAAQIEVDQTSLLEYTESMEPTNRAALYLLDSPAQTPHGAAFTAILQPDLQVTLREPLRERTSFNASSYTSFRYGRDESAEALEHWMHLPPGNPRTRELAQQLSANGASPQQIVARVLDMLHKGDYYYTTHPPLLGRESVDEFLFDSRRGFCEHYAGSFVFLMRAAGVPARVVTGYQGGDVNPINLQMTIRQSDAHAWAEVWYANAGWVRVDPTAAVAPQRIERGFEQGVESAQGFAGAFRVTGRGWMRYAMYNLEALNNAWNRWIVAYSDEEQHSLFRNWGMPDIDWQGLAIGLIVVFGLVAAALSSQVILRRPRVDPVQALYWRLCGQLEKRGVTRRPSEGPRDFLLRATPFVDEPNLSKVRRAFALYELLRYGRSAESPEQLLRGLRTCVRSLHL